MVELNIIWFIRVATASISAAAAAAAASAPAAAVYNFNSTPASFASYFFPRLYKHKHRQGKKCERKYYKKGLVIQSILASFLSFFLFKFRLNIFFFFVVIFVIFLH